MEMAVERLRKELVNLSHWTFRSRMCCHRIVLHSTLGWSNLMCSCALENNIIQRTPFVFLIFHPTCACWMTTGSAKFGRILQIWSRKLKHFCQHCVDLSITVGYMGEEGGNGMCGPALRSGGKPNFVSGVEWLKWLVIRIGGDSTCSVCMLMVVVKYPSTGEVQSPPPLHTIIITIITSRERESWGSWNTTTNGTIRWWAIGISRITC